MFLPYQEIFVWALFLSFISALVYRVFTKPGEMRQIKKDMKFYREKSKEAQQQKDLKKANEYVSEMMKLNQKQMRRTMKPMFITLGVFLVLISFITQAYGVVVETKAADDKTATGQFSSAGFSHALMVEKTNESAMKAVIDANDNGDFSDDAVYAAGDVVQIGKTSWTVSPQDLNRTKIDVAVKLPFTMPLFGWHELSWLIWYILVSLPSTFIFRKALGVE